MKDLGKAFRNGQGCYPKDMESALAWITSREEAAGHMNKQNTTKQQMTKTMMAQRM